MVTNGPRSSESSHDAGPSSPHLETPAARRVTINTAELAPLRSWLEDQLAAALDVEQRKMLIVAATEAVTNAMEAHQRSETDQPVQVTVDGRAELVTVEDRGGGLDPDRAEAATAPAPSAQRGRGLLIIRSVCPNARFVETGTGTRVELPFRP